MFALYREKSSSGDIIWLDAVTDKDESYSSSLTKHPIEKGASISDHKVNEPVSIRLTGVISDYDFHNTRPILEGDERLTSKNVGNDTSKGTHIGNGNDLATRLLPESLNNLVSTISSKKIPEVTIDRFGKQEALKTKDLLKKLWESGEPLTLLGFNSNKKVDNFTNLVITNINFPESSDSYDAVYFNMILEEVFVTVLRKGTTPNFIAPKEEVRNATATKGSGVGGNSNGSGVAKTELPTNSVSGTKSDPAAGNLSDSLARKNTKGSTNIVGQGGSPNRQGNW